MMVTITLRVYFKGHLSTIFHDMYIPDFLHYTDYSEQMF